MSQITGTETKQSLRDLCVCDPSKKNALVLEAECFKAYLNDECGDRGLCLGDLNIPIEGAFCLSKSIAPDSIFTLTDVLCDFKWLGVFVKENKTILYRELDDCSDNFETVNYFFDVNIPSFDVALDKVTATIDITLTPDNTTYVATWDGVDTIYINGVPFQTWLDINLSWFDIGASNISNSLKFPTIISSQEVDFINDGSGNFTDTKKLTVTSDDGKISYEFDLEINYDYNTDTMTCEVKNVKLMSQFRDENVVIQQTDTPATFAASTFDIVGGGFPSVGFSAGDSFEVGGETFTEGVEFAIGANDAATAQALVDAINANVTINSLITASHNYVAGANGGGTITITADTAGTAATAITTSVLVGNHTASSTTLVGGYEAVNSKTITKTGTDYTINSKGGFKSISARRYKGLEAVTVLSGGGDLKLGDIEFYNYNNFAVEICVLAAL